MSFHKTIVYKLHQIIYTLDASANSGLLANFGISYDDFMVLNLIFNYPEMNQQDLADTLRLNKSTISLKLKKLEKKGWLARQSSKKSDREKTLTLTKAGLDLYHKSSRQLDKNSQKVFKNLKNPVEFEAELDRVIEIMNGEL